MQIIIERYPYWWDLSSIVRLPDPIPCRGDVGMWTLDADLRACVSEVRTAV